MARTIEGKLPPSPHSSKLPDEIRCCFSRLRRRLRFRRDTKRVGFSANRRALAFGGVGVAYAFAGPLAFGKRTNGTLPAWSRALYAPYFAINALSLWGFRRSSRENDCDEIAPNIYLGCKLNQSDRAAIERMNIQSVFDLTSEFGEIACLRGLNYRALPLLDTCAPKLDELQGGAQWVLESARTGPVYVHCALGHGRSATFVAAALMLSGRAQDAEIAVEQIRRKRPHIGLTRAQLAVLWQLQGNSARRPLSN